MLPDVEPEIPLRLIETRFDIAQQHVTWIWERYVHGFSRGYIT